MNKSVKVFAPATIANVGPGFDVLGLAIENLGDIVVATVRPQGGLVFNLADSKTQVPSDQNNVAAHVANLMLQEMQVDFGVELTLHKAMPISSGLGSSGASAAAAAFAVNALLPKPLSKKDLIRFAMEGEKLASGTAHADNVAPSLLGGICLIQSYNPLRVVQLPIKNDIIWVVAHPHIEIKTQTARDLLPKMISLSEASEQWGNLAGLVTGLLTNDNNLISASLKDNIVEPARAALILNYYDVKTKALEAGALGVGISGSGPSVFAAAPSLDVANKIGAVIKTTFLDYAGYKSDIYISKINMDGAKILE